MSGGSGWQQDALMRAEAFEAVVPCPKTGLSPLARHGARFQAMAHLVTPDGHSTAVLFGKHQARKRALQSGVAVPPGRLMRHDGTTDRIVAEFGTPVVVKLRRSYALYRLHARGRVQVMQPAAGFLPDCEAL